MKVERFYVQFAGSNGKTRFVGNVESRYPTQRDAARLFATVEHALDAADNIVPRYIDKGAVPIIRSRFVFEAETIVTLPGLHAH